MEDNQACRSIGVRTSSAMILGCRVALRAIWLLLRIIVPVTLVVAFLDWIGVLLWITRLMGPLMSLVGLSGAAFLVFIVSIFLNIYGAIAVALSLSLDMRSATILAVMCLTAHNLFHETAVMKKTGSSGVKMILLRIGFAFVGAFVFNLLLPSYLRCVPFSAAVVGRPGLWGMLVAWGLATAPMCAKIALIVLGVSVAQRLLEEFKVMDRLSRLFSPIMRIFGLPREVSALWIAINVVGYPYGAAIAEGQVKAGSMKPQEADLFNHHAGLCHSLMEGTVLFFAFGVPLFWITLPRLGFAFLAVWVERARRRFFRRSFRVGTV
jgi:spore maturation protein SpmB